MNEGHAPRDRWRLLDPGGAVVVQRSWRSWLDRRTDEVSSLPSRTPVVVEANGFAAAWRCNRFVRKAKLIVDERFIALPSLAHEAIRVENTPAGRAYFCSALLTVPPGSGRATPVLDLAVSVARIAARTRLLATMARGCVLVARAP